MSPLLSLLISRYSNNASNFQTPPVRASAICRLLACKTTDKAVREWSLTLVGERWRIEERNCSWKMADRWTPVCTQAGEWPDRTFYRPAGKITCKILTGTRGTRKNAARQRVAAEAGQGSELSPVDEHVGVPHEGWASGGFIAVHRTDRFYSFLLSSIWFLRREKTTFELHIDESVFQKTNWTTVEVNQRL